MTYTECLACLAQLGHEVHHIKFDLDAVGVVLDALGNPERSYPTAIVAGTNGKGSTSAMLASVLSRAGYRTGLYTSPHLVRVNERIRVSGRDISDARFAGTFTLTWQTARELVQSGNLHRDLTYFELLTATAFLQFKQERVDFAVLEVGMGGRLDATNVTVPRVAVITNVALDHEEFLGRSHQAIAGEKAGVIKPGRPVVSACDQVDSAEVIRQTCQEMGSRLVDLPRQARFERLRNHGGRFEFDLLFDRFELRDLAPRLAGKFQVQNASAAAAAACILIEEGFAISSDAIREGLSSVRWPGRLQAIHRAPLVLLDGAHNPAAAGVVADFIREQFRGRRIRLVYASMRDKDIEDISALLFPLAHEVYVTHVDVERSASPEEILQRAGERPERAFVEHDPVAALQSACRSSGRKDVVLVAGSLYLVGEIQRARRAGRLALGSDPVGSLAPRLL
jgi:dihydrofolate synthase / folylpolyglutamate synthase